MEQVIQIYTDGSCETQKRIGAYAAILRYGKHKRNIHARVEDATVNQMELTAIVEALKVLKKKGQQVQVFTDSTYVARGVNEWMPDWIERGWKTKRNKPVANIGLWQELKKLLDVHGVAVNWIPREENTEADALAQATRRQEISEEAMKHSQIIQGNQGTDERSVTNEHHLLIAGSRDASAEMLNYARRAVRRAHEKGYTILVGDNPKGVDKAVVQEVKRLGAKAVVFGIANFPRNGGIGSDCYVKVTSGLYSAMNGRRYAAYHARDRYMVDMAQTGLFIWDGDSKGTKAGYDYMDGRANKDAHLKEF